MGFIGRSLRGEEDLWKIFWIYGALFGYGLQVGLTEYLLPRGGYFALGALGFYLLYVLWLFAAVWRCAFNADLGFWGYLLRTLQTMIIVAVLIGALALTGVVQTPAAAPLKSAVEAAMNLPKCQTWMAEQAKAQGLDPKKYIQSNKDALVACMNAQPLSKQQPNRKTK